ncbi:hypothetical protein SLEP1_g46417 [Rubroshorea leprosula]|uniref:Secreted protein n=1 Tax=Rubroshorea leprosula TaxID=152421 RepID=A0AAV5LM43_9ROSI|nr:hypothetical protein SLEP1_g46417 [Rubroshorea leprosula]
MAFLSLVPMLTRQRGSWWLVGMVFCTAVGNPSFQIAGKGWPGSVQGRKENRGKGEDGSVRKMFWACEAPSPADGGEEVAGCWLLAEAWGIRERGRGGC